MTDITVNVQLNGHIIEDGEAVRSQFGDFFMSSLVTTPSRNQLETERKIESFLCTSDGWPKPCGGLKEIIDLRARASGRQVCFRSTFPIESPSNAISSMVIANPAAVQLVSQHPRGIIRYNNRWSMRQVLLDISRAFQDIRIYIVDSKVERLESIGQSLSAQGVTCQTVVRNCHALREDAPYDRGVVLSTFAPQSSDDFTKSGLVVFVDASAVIHRKARELLVMQPDLRPALFGLLDAKRNLSPFERDSITAAFGLRHVNLTRPGHRTRQAQLAFVRFHARHQPPAATTTTGTRRSANVTTSTSTSETGLLRASPMR